MKLVFIALFFFLSANLFGAVSAKGTNLGEVSAKVSETLPAKVLFDLLTANPDIQVVGAIGTVAINDKVKDYCKWYYDSKEKVWVIMKRTTMPQVEDYYSWVYWANITPEEFKTGFPFLSETLKPKLSGMTKGNPKQTFPFKYEDNPKITEWP